MLLLNIIPLIKDANFGFKTFFNLFQIYLQKDYFAVKCPLFVLKLFNTNNTAGIPIKRQICYIKAKYHIIINILISSMETIIKKEDLTVIVFESSF